MNFNVLHVLIVSSLEETNNGALRALRSADIFLLKLVSPACICFDLSTGCLFFSENDDGSDDDEIGVE